MFKADNGAFVAVDDDPAERLVISLYEGFEHRIVTPDEARQIAAALLEAAQLIDGGALKVPVVTTGVPARQQHFRS
ncbi:MAG: hypothetical protein M3010_05590 [Candidatus Dormibacteraeota bacterium]|nr:hypothetical protein [Candidatus Dormibacteraeota bacterium]